MTTETARLEAFSDGVYAIAITLLILEIKVPPPGPEPLARELLQQWPSYISYLISFAFIGIMWINHHRMFTHIKRSDNGVLLLNLLLLFWICAVPFPTAVLAAHLGQPGQLTATLLYHATYICISIAYNLLWRYASSTRRQLLEHDADREDVDHITRQYSYGPLPFLLCFALAYVNVPVSLLLSAITACLFALPPSVMRAKT